MNETIRDIQAIGTRFYISTSVGKIYTFTEHDWNLSLVFTSGKPEIIHSFETSLFNEHFGLGIFSIEGQGLFIQQLFSDGTAGNIVKVDVGKIKIKEIKIISSEIERVWIIAVNGKSEVKIIQIRLTQGNLDC